MIEITDSQTRKQMKVIMMMKMRRDRNVRENSMNKENDWKKKFLCEVWIEETWACIGVDTLNRRTDASCFQVVLYFENSLDRENQVAALRI